jgi:dephospho-CoA kinase
MLKVALTGGAATGKSYVLDQFLRRGVPCLIADDLAHGVTASGTEATAAIAARFGADVLATDGSVNREVLGPIVFADEAARRELEAIVHPVVYRAIEAGMRAFARLGGSPFAIAEIPLLFETGHASDFDRVIVTACAPDVQMSRLAGRGKSETQARQIVAAQMPTEEKAARANFVIRTDGRHAETDAQVQKIFDQLR